MLESTRPTFVDRLKLFDFLTTKTPDDVAQRRTSSGAAFTIATALLLLFLLLSNISSYWSIDTEDVLTVDTSRGGTLRINLDIHFPNLICHEIAVDVVDGTTGETLTSAAFQIIKTRLKKDDTPISISKQIELGKPQASRMKEECPLCTEGLPAYQLVSARMAFNKKCCYDCNDIREQYRRAFFPQDLADQTPQCKIEIPVTDNEACRIHGYLEVAKGKGDFHIAAGHGYAQAHESHSHHVHAIDFSRLHKFNLTHKVNSLSFGPEIPGIKNPLDDHVVVASSLIQHTYYMQVVPTEYYSGNKGLRTNQYSFTQHVRQIRMTQQEFALPGIYFKYDMSPLMIQISEKDKSFVGLITSICAIVGGIYVAFGIIYSLTYTVVKSTSSLKKSR